MEIGGGFQGGPYRQFPVPEKGGQSVGALLFVGNPESSGLARRPSDQNIVSTSIATLSNPHQNER